MSAAVVLIAGLIVATTARAQTQLAKLTADDAVALDKFGKQVVISEDENTVVVVAFPLEDFPFTIETGSAYVFVGSGTSWTQQAKLTAGDLLPAEAFGGGKSSVSISGDTVVVTASLADSRTGAAYVFVRNAAAGTWAQQAKLVASDGVADDEFGHSVSIDGDTVVVGTFDADGDLFNESGTVYVFVRVGSTWTEQAKLAPIDGASFRARFGGDISISGDTVLVGAFADDDFAPNSGSAYVFVRSAGIWSQQAKLHASDGAENDSFGGSVSLDGDTAVVGANRDDANAGSAYVFERSGFTWTQQAKLTAVDRTPGANFAFNVSVSGDTVVVGARSVSAAYMFLRGSGTWSQQTKFTACDRETLDQFGVGAAISGGTIVIGAKRDDDAGTDSGSAYIFSAALDTDSDGLFDRTEVDIAEGCGGCPDPLNPDSDGDTLLDGDEVASGTDPCNVDSDGDGVPDNLDLLPLDPDVPGELLEEATRALCGLIQALDLGLFNGPNDNANKGRRNSLANRACKAANRIADGQIDAAIALLDSLLDKVDGADPPPDWMDPSPPKSALADQVTLLLVELLIL